MKNFIAVLILLVACLSCQFGQAQIINEVKRKPVIVRFTDEEGNTEKIIIERKPQSIAPKGLRAPSVDLRDDTMINPILNDNAGFTPNEMVNPIRSTIYNTSF